MRVAGGLCAGSVPPGDERGETARSRHPSLQPAVVISVAWAFSAVLLVLMAGV
jgi:hypothetical protein